MPFHITDVWGVGSPPAYWSLFLSLEAHLGLGQMEFPLAPAEDEVKWCLEGRDPLSAAQVHFTVRMQGSKTKRRNSNTDKFL